MLRYTVLLRRNTDVPGYSVMVPELPGCFTFGDTLEEALANAKEAIECRLEAIAQDAEEIPIEEEPFVVTTVVVTTPLPHRSTSFTIEGHRVVLKSEDVVEVAKAMREEPAPGHYCTIVDGLKRPTRKLFVQALAQKAGLTGLTQITTHRAGDVFGKLGFVTRVYSPEEREYRPIYISFEKQGRSE